jgi:GNAT superfamily N-acetyltransferase
MANANTIKTRPTIREATVADAEGIAHVHVAVWNSTYASIVPQEFLDSRTVTQKTDEWRERLVANSVSQNKFTLVALSDEGKVLGFCSGGPKRDGPAEYDAEIYAIYVLDEHHGNGVGKDLLFNMMRQLHRLDFQAVMLWALNANAKAVLYGNCGGVACGEKTINIGGADLVETAWGWPSISTALRKELTWREWRGSDNVSELTRLIRLCYEPHAIAGLRFNATWQQDHDTLRRISEGRCYVMHLRAQVVATVTLEDSDPENDCHYFRDPKTATFHQFCVHPDLQKLGVGRDIINSIAAEARGRGYSQLALDTAEPATALRTYYERLGFKTIGTHQWPTTNYRSVVLIKSI